jgi:excisionase family DNA binding protein
MAQNPGARRVYNVEEAADLLGVGRSTLYRLIKAQQVPHRVLPTGVIRFTDADIESVLADAHRPAVA